MTNVALPEGWIAETLANVIEPRGEKVSPSAFPHYKFIGMDHVESHTTKIIGFAPASTMKSSAARFFAGDILYGRLRPYLNKVAQPTFDGLASAEFMVFPNTELIRSSFLKYRLNAADFVSFASHLNEGDRPRVGFDQIGNFKILVPPPREQDRIVAKLEVLFSELDNGIESLKTAQEQLNLYRAIVLDQAIYRIGTKNIRTYRLAELIGTIQQGWSPKCDLNRTPLNGEWAIIKTTAVQPMRHIPEECKPLPEALEPRPAIEIHERDILMTRKGPRPRTGVVCLVRRARPNSMLCDTVYRFRAKEAIVTPEYLELALNAPRTVAEIDRRKSGINDSGISLNHGRINAIELPIPNDLATQITIVQAMAEKMSRITNLEAEIEQQLARSEVLRQAILKRAFSGKLLTQDPTDEPASALLERIARERAGGNPSKRGRNPREVAYG